MTAFSFVMTIESSGHAETHSPQPLHLAKSTFTGIIVFEVQGKLTRAILAAFSGFARG